MWPPSAATRTFKAKRASKKLTAFFSERDPELGVEHEHKVGHVPLRTCVGCRTIRPKNELLRLVRTPEGLLEIDPLQRKPGRGAYICLRLDCAKQMKKRRALDRSFRRTVPNQFYEEVIAYVREQLGSQD